MLTGGVDWVQICMHSVTTADLATYESSVTDDLGDYHYFASK